MCVYCGHFICLFCFVCLYVLCPVSSPACMGLNTPFWFCLVWFCFIIETLLLGFAWCDFDFVWFAFSLRAVTLVVINYSGGVRRLFLRGLNWILVQLVVVCVCFLFLCFRRWGFFCREDLSPGARCPSCISTVCLTSEVFTCVPAVLL